MEFEMMDDSTFSDSSEFTDSGISCSGGHPSILSQFITDSEGFEDINGFGSSGGVPIDPETARPYLEESFTSFSDDISSDDFSRNHQLIRTRSYRRRNEITAQNNNQDIILINNEISNDNLNSDNDSFETISINFEHFINLRRDYDNIDLNLPERFKIENEPLSSSDDKITDDELYSELSSVSRNRLRYLRYIKPRIQDRFLAYYHPDFTILPYFASLILTGFYRYEIGGLMIVDGYQNCPLLDRFTFLFKADGYVFGVIIDIKGSRTMPTYVVCRANMNDVYIRNEDNIFYTLHPAGNTKFYRT